MRAAVACVAAAVALSAAPGAARAAYNPCPSEPVAAWQGSSDGQAISIPSLTQPNGHTDWAGSIFRPADLAAYPGTRPLVVLQHGLGGNQCGLYWVARFLAGHGYITMVWTSPTDNDKTKAFLNGRDAMRSAIAFARSGANPYAGITDTTRIGLGGHSMGSIITSVVQGDPDPGVKGGVAFDNLRRWTSGDPGAASFECTGDRIGEVTPRVPVLGFAKDEPCDALPDVTDPDLKEAGFEWWRSHGVPSMELVMAGFEHKDFAGGGTDLQHRYLAHYTLAWMNRWVAGDTPAATETANLLTDTVEGAPVTSILSSHYLSGAYLPPDVDTSDYVAWILSDRVAPVTKKKDRMPTGYYTHAYVKRLGLVFRFKASEKSRFECKLDGGGWKHCSSPRRFKHLKARKHAFRVRAIDLAGNVDRTPIVWHFRVGRP